ncbi:nicotinate phosphoribosyltransferase [Parapedobacter deserti]|uniref:Nicotinate phosphoribosyltransferase n=1 Tax=Parapedobacter deserti TaxID=1912957 RepID=A0ABV7JJP4_9SPHI
MIHSILDNDFYKFTMQHAVVKLFPKAKAKYQFINRGNHKFPDGFAHRLQVVIDELASLQLTRQEKLFFATSCPYIDPTYFDFLQGYRYDPDEVQVKQRGDDVHIVVEGYWYRTILWEVPLMSLICELYYQLAGQQRQPDDQVTETAREKIEKYRELGVTIAEFGTRRRHSYGVHQQVVQALTQFGEGAFIGTSNVHLAMRYRTKPIGTHAHEWFMFHAAKYGFKMATLLGLEHWSDVYRGDLGIALSDTYTTDVFFSQFDKKLTKLFDGVRHDSGDPLTFADKAIRHYEQKGIDPMSKTIIFSDGLNYEKVARIAEYCRGRIGMSFGIGTNLTNDVGLVPMNLVIKMTEAFPEEAQWTPVIKLSDESGKHTGDAGTIALAKQILHITSYGT